MMTGSKIEVFALAFGYPGFEHPDSEHSSTGCVRVKKLRSRPLAGLRPFVAKVTRTAGTGVLAFSVWLAPATTHFEANRNGDANLASWGVAVSASPLDAITTASLSLATGGAVFGGTNVAEKTARARPVPTALEIAKGFRAARLNFAELRDNPVSPDIAGAFAKVETGNVAGPADRFVADTDRIVLAALPNTGAITGADALEAISEVAAPDRDPARPYPVPVPVKLAYAREAAPETVFKPTLRPALSASRNERRCLAEAIYFEARGESYRGQVAVAQVVRNRVESSVFPNTICAVVYQNKQKRNACQFSFACDGIRDRVNERSAWAQAREIADKVIAGELYLPEVSDAINYHASYVRPPWASRMKRVTRIGAHIFYRFRRG
jgi:spore germination cell wall hydrolase CwlJ-like protein